MTTDNHTPIPDDGFQEATAALFNSRFSELDTSLGDLDLLGTTRRESLVRAIGSAALRTPYDFALTPAINSVYDLIVDAQGAINDLEAQLANLVIAGGNVSTLTNGSASAGQKVVIVDSSSGFIPPSYVAYSLVGGGLEYNQIATIDSGTQITLVNNIGTGGIGNDTLFTMISVSEYNAANAINHGDVDMTLAKAIEYTANNAYFGTAYNMSPSGNAAVNTAALLDAVGALVDAGRGEIVIPAGIFKLVGDTVILPELAYRAFGVLRGAGPGATMLQIESPETGAILTVQGNWRIENISFLGYEDGADSAAGIGVLVQKMDEPGGFSKCQFSILEYGIKTDEYEAYESGSAMGNALIESCVFDACKEAGVYIDDVHNANHIINCHFLNGYPAGSGSGLGVYAGYQSNLVIHGCNFRTHKHGVYLKGAQSPQISNCYFETTSSDSGAYIVTTRTVAPTSPANYAVRNLSVQGCSASFYDDTQSFAQLRYCLNPTFIGNWTTAQGDGFIDADTTVKGIVLLNNHQDHDNTPAFAGDDTVPPYSAPNGSVALIVDSYNPTNMPLIHLAKSIYTLPDGDGYDNFVFYAGSIQALYINADYVATPNGLIIGGGNQITKHIYQQVAIDFGSISANSSVDSDVTVTGVTNADEITVTPVGVPESGLMYNAFYKTTNTVTVRCANVTAGDSIDPGNRTFNITVTQH